MATQWAGAAAPGLVLLDLSTTLPASNQAIAAGWRRGHHFVEAPLTGGAMGAQGRALVFMVGGDDEPVARCLPLLEQLGRATFHLGPVGAGSTMKLVNSLLAFACTWASLEGLSLAAAAGIDLRTAVEVVRTGGASNFFIDRGVDGIDTGGRPAVHPGAGGQGRRAHRGAGRRARHPGAGRRGDRRGARRRRRGGLGDRTGATCGRGRGARGVEPRSRRLPSPGRRSP